MHWAQAYLCVLSCVPVFLNWVPQTYAGFSSIHCKEFKAGFSSIHCKNLKLYFNFDALKENVRMF